VLNNAAAASSTSVACLASPCCVASFHGIKKHAEKNAPSKPNSTPRSAGDMRRPEGARELVEVSMMYCLRAER
jgi:hypothetical protein